MDGNKRDGNKCKPFRYYVNFPNKQAKEQAGNLLATRVLNQSAKRNVSTYTVLCGKKDQGHSLCFAYVTFFFASVQEVEKKEARKKRTAFMSGDCISCTQEDGSRLDVKFHLRSCTVSVTSQKDSFELMDAFFRLNQRVQGFGFQSPMSVDLYHGTSPSKEALECMAAYRCIMAHGSARIAARLGADATTSLRQVSKDVKEPSNDAYLAWLDDPSVLCLCVGDGIAPKVGYLFAATTKWQVLSIDPEMRNKWSRGQVVGVPHNLHCIARKVEDVDLERDWLPKYSQSVIVVAVHSHANLDQLYKRLHDNVDEKLVLSMACCTGFVHHLDASMNYARVQKFRDWRLLTDKNDITMWHVVKSSGGSEDYNKKSS